MLGPAITTVPGYRSGICSVPTAPRELPIVIEAPVPAGVVFDLLVVAAKVIPRHVEATIIATVISGTEDALWFVAAHSTNNGACLLPTKSVVRPPSMDDVLTRATTTKTLDLVRPLGSGRRLPVKRWRRHHHWIMATMLPCSDLEFGVPIISLTHEINRSG